MLTFSGSLDVHACFTGEKILFQVFVLASRAAPRLAASVTFPVSKLLPRQRASFW